DGGEEREQGLRRFGPAAVALACLGCASAYNYTDPKGPRVVTGLNVPAPERPDGTLRVVTFNIEYGKRVDEAIEALRKPPLADADVILLQEMDAGGVARLAAALGLNSVYFPASRPPQTTRSFGNGILSRYAILESHKIVLPGLSRGIHQARASVAATLEIGERRVVVYSIHLSSPVGMSGGGRERQIDALLADAAKVTEPVVLAGDFNSGGIGERIAAQGYQWAT